MTEWPDEDVERVSHAVGKAMGWTYSQTAANGPIIARAALSVLPSPSAARDKALEEAAQIALLNGASAKAAERIRELKSSAPAPDGAPDDAVLLCDVRLPPATTITKGCKLSTLMEAMKAREVSGVVHFPETKRAREMMKSGASDLGRSQLSAPRYFVECSTCGGSGFSSAGTGYGNVCGECGGQKFFPVASPSAELAAMRKVVEAAEADGDAEEALGGVSVSKAWWMNLQAALDALIAPTPRKETLE